MVNKDEDVAQEEMPLANGKSVIQYIEQDGSPSTKFSATFMCEYIYNNEGVLVAHNISNNPYFGANIDNSDDTPKEKRISLFLSENTINKLEKLAKANNLSKSEFITQLIDNL